MSGSIKDAKKSLADAIVSLKQAKQVIEFITNEGRMLMPKEDWHQLKDLSLIAGSDAATIEACLNEFGSIGFGSSRMAVQNQNVETK